MDKNPVPINSAAVPATKSANRRRSKDNNPTDEKTIPAEVTPQKSPMPPYSPPHTIYVWHNENAGSRVNGFRFEPDGDGGKIVHYYRDNADSKWKLTTLRANEPEITNYRVDNGMHKIDMRHASDDRFFERKFEQEQIVAPAQVPSSMAKAPVVHASDSKGMDLAVIVGIAAAATVVLLGVGIGAYTKKKADIVTSL